MLILTGAVTAAFTNAIPNSFHYDDFHGIVNNPTIRDLRNSLLFLTDPSTFSLSHHNDWRPLLQISFAMNYLIDGPNPSVFRLFNLLIHLGCAILVFSIVDEIHKEDLAHSTRQQQSSGSWFALLSALIFAVHPANSEVVNYIWARSSLLSAFFYLCGFYGFLRWLRSSGGKFSSHWYITTVGFYVFGLATKATAITLPVAMMLYDYLRSASISDTPVPFGRWVRFRLVSYLPFMVIGSLYVVLRIVLLPESFARVIDFQDISSSTYFLSSIRAWVYYFGLYLWPARLLVNFHGFGWSTSLWDPSVLASMGVNLSILGLAWKFRSNFFPMGFFTMWFFVALLPEQSFLPLSEPVNGYRPYLAFAGVSAVIAQLWILATMHVREVFIRIGVLPLTRIFPTIECACLVCLLVTLTSTTVRRNMDWRDERTLWSDVLRKDPNNPRALMNLSLDFSKQGKLATAETMLETAVTIAPKNSYAHLLRGYLAQLRDQPELARLHFTTAVTLDPRSAYALFYRAEFLRTSGEFTEAIDAYRRSLTLKPHFTDARYGLAMTYLQDGDIEAGQHSCERILVIDRRDGRAYRCLGRIAMERKQFVEATRIFQTALQYLPRDPEIWHELGLTYLARNLFAEAAVAFQKSPTRQFSDTK